MELCFIELFAFCFAVDTLLLHIIDLINNVPVAGEGRICGVNCCLALGVAREDYEGVLRITDEHLFPLYPASHSCFCRFFEVQLVLDVLLLEFVEVRTVDVLVRRDF